MPYNIKLLSHHSKYNLNNAHTDPEAAHLTSAPYNGTSSCTLNASGDTPQLTSKEDGRKRDAQDNLVSTFWDPKP
jgi:hypothetical protein